ncbi:MAG: hypothetical protein OSJ56_01590 [Prevotella sp.]|uniref:sigma factor n=1 Tax=Prevotella sp. PTAC TaxID=2736295 RepID=UPI001555AAC3|nr:sigma factor [Prevotella sp. PTAC]MCX4292737.1 hypothetical protein [Prevotella sp.]NPD53265.1 hypothetical protein [Prevotella sp. PTAC]
MFREEYLRCYFFARRMLDEDDLCRDTVSDGFASVWSNRRCIDALKARCYLYTCVRNKALSELRRIKTVGNTVAAGVLDTLESDDGEEWGSMHAVMSGTGEKAAYGAVLILYMVGGGRGGVCPCLCVGARKPQRWA